LYFLFRYIPSAPAHLRGPAAPCPTLRAQSVSVPCPHDVNERGVAPGNSPDGQLLGALSPRFGALPPGARASVAPDDARLAVFVDTLLRPAESDAGAALVVDYGAARAAGDSFRAFRAYAQTSPFAAPGTADLTADVDFALLSRANAPSSSKLDACTATIARRTCERSESSGGVPKSGSSTSCTTRGRRATRLRWAPRASRRGRRGCRWCTYRELAELRRVRKLTRCKAARLHAQQLHPVNLCLCQSC
jgi:hypothetical protein